MRDHLPGPRTITEGLGVQCADRAQIDDVAGQLVIDGPFDERAHGHMLATTDHAELLQPGDLLGEANAARALNAASHVRRYQRAETLVLHHALALVEARDVATETDGEILQLALPALIADGAIEGMIDEQELHGRALRRRGPRRAREDLHAL